MTKMTTIDFLDPLEGNIYGARMIQVIVTKEHRILNQGTPEQSFAMVTVYYTLDGLRLAEVPYHPPLAPTITVTSGIDTEESNGHEST